MNFINVLWIFILLASLAPMVKQRVLDSERFRLMRKVEEKARFARDRADSPPGKHVLFRISQLPATLTSQDSEEIMRAVKMTDSKIPIDIILHTPGGLVLAAEQIALRPGQTQGQSDGFHPALCHVRRHHDRPGRRRDRHGR